MEDFVTLLQTAENGNGIFHRRFRHHNRLETALQSGVFFNIFAVFIQRRCADTMQLTARQHRFEQIARVHAAFGLARADDGMKLIDEQNNPAIAGFNIV